MNATTALLPVYAGMSGAAATAASDPRFCPICGSPRDMAEGGCGGCGSRLG